MNLILNTPKNTRKTLARVMRNFNKGEVSKEKMQAIVYASSILLSYFKHESAESLEKRIQVLEERML